MEVKRKLLPYDFEDESKLEDIKDEIRGKKNTTEYANHILDVSSDVADNQARIRSQAAFEVLAETDDENEYYDEYSIIKGISTDAAETVDYTVATVREEYLDIAGYDSNSLTRVVNEDGKEFIVNIDEGGVERCDCVSSDFGEGYCTHIDAAQEVIHSDVTMYDVVSTRYGSKVAVNIDYARIDGEFEQVKDRFKDTLEWDETHRTWNGRYDCWTIDIESVEYAQERLQSEGFDVEVYSEVREEYEKSVSSYDFGDLDGNLINTSERSIQVLEYANEVVNGSEWSIDIDLSNVGIGVVATGLSVLDKTDRNQTVKVSRSMWERSDWETVKETVRHELVHVWQLQNEVVEMDGKEYEVELGHDGSWEVWENRMDVQEMRNAYDVDFDTVPYTFECPSCDLRSGCDYRTARKVKAVASGLDSLVWGLVVCRECDCLLYLTREKNGEKQYYQSGQGWSMLEVRMFATGFEMSKAVTEVDIHQAE